MTKFKFKLHHLMTLNRRYPRYTSAWALIMCAVMEIIAAQLDEEGQ